MKPCPSPFQAASAAGNAMRFLLVLFVFLRPAVASSGGVGGSREERFPSVQERVQLYMSNWYAPPCSESNRFLYNWTTEEASNGTDASDFPVFWVRSFNGTWFAVQDQIEPDMLFYMDRRVIDKCAQFQSTKTSKRRLGQTTNKDDVLASRIRFPQNMRMYCQDIVDSMMPALDHLEDDSVAILLQFGDMKHSHVFGKVDLIHVKKFRSAALQPFQMTETECVEGDRLPLHTVHGNQQYQPIVWKLATHRHYRLLPQVYRQDTPWESKETRAIFRGQLTGALEGYNKALSDKENCQNLKRCRLVLSTAHSSLIDAKLTSTRNRLPDKIDGIPLLAETVTIRTLLRYKGIIMLEGNDVASGLKWALLSQSVVLMPPPKHTSWAMEELLQPWVHYIPLNQNATDVEEKMKWVKDHDQEAMRISERATLWMEDLVFHPDAAQDDRLIEEEMLRRYRAHFVQQQPPPQTSVSQA